MAFKIYSIAKITPCQAIVTGKDCCGETSVIVNHFGKDYLPLCSRHAQSILGYQWQEWLRENADTPIYMTPIAKTGIIGKKSYGEDGIRITGSWNFIASILGRIKDIWKVLIRSKI